jgi:hypothetical protein
VVAQDCGEHLMKARSAVSSFYAQGVQNYLESGQARTE